MAEPKDGGPAFPTEPKYSIRKDGAQLCLAAQPGMTLRDWFAGQALSGILAFHTADTARQINAKDAALAAYVYADAMLAEREK